MKELEGVDRKLSLAQWALNVSGGRLAVLLRLLKVCNILGHRRSSRGFPLLGRRLVAGAEVAGVLVSRALVTVRAHLDEASAGHRAGSRWRSRQLHLGVVRLSLGVGAAVEQAQARAVVVEGADVADEGGCVNDGGLTFAEHIVPICVATFLQLEGLPLGDEEGSTVLTTLDTACAVHGTTAGWTSVDHKAWVVRSLAAVLPRVDEEQASLLVLVPTDVADLGEGVLVREREVKDVRGTARTFAHIT